MAEKGMAIMILLLLIIVGVAVIPGIIISLNPTVKLIFTLIIVLMIIGLVQSYLGPGKLTWLIALVLIFIAIRNIEFIGSAYTLYMLIGTGLTSAIIWGIGPGLGKKMTGSK